MEKHGGQDIYENFHKLIDDFSVTTNYLGPSKLAMSHIKKNLHLIHHYPKDDKEPYKTNILSFLFDGIQHTNPHLVFGNGASEVIDLVIRTSCMLHPEYTSYFVNSTQYMEYERSCKLQKLTLESVFEQADIVSIINPCNPTGDYLDIVSLMAKINTCKPNSTVIIDESMQLWKGPDFRNDSMISHYEYIQSQLSIKNVKIFIIHSYTKFFSCTGLRIGSVLCPDDVTEQTILHYQNPWSNNILALEYLDICIRDEKYCRKTWNTTEMMRTYQCSQIHKYFPEWKIYGVSFISWIWIELPNQELAENVYEISKKHHMPIRWGKMGYNKPTFIRIAVRKNKYFDKLLHCWRRYCIHPNVTLSVPANNRNSNMIQKYISNPTTGGYMNVEIKRVKIKELKSHEKFSTEKFDKLYNYYNNLADNIRIIPTILVDIHTNVIIDGHHRFQLLLKLGCEYADVSYIDYMNCDNIVVNPHNTTLTKRDVIQMGLSNDLYAQKTTQHMIYINGKMQPIICLSTNILIYNEY